MDFRSDFPLLSNQANGHPIAYLDNAATSQKPQVVLDAITDFYTKTNANVHRGVYRMAEEATALYEAGRETVRRFLNAASTEEIIFTHGTTEGLNVVAQMMIENVLEPGDTVVVSESEHHSNIVPWQIVGKRQGTGMKYIPVDETGTLKLDELDKLFTFGAKVLAIQYASNATGIVHDLPAIIARAKANGMLVVIDAAQAAPHFPIDVQALGCDFLAFSGHKTFGPTGIGVLYGRKELLEKYEPVLGGGEMISRVHRDESTWAALPHKFEAGTPHIAGVAGLKAAVEYIEQVGWEALRKIEDDLLHYAWEKLSAVPSLRLHRPQPFDIRHSTFDIPTSLPIFPFSLSDVHPHDIAQILDEQGVCVRAGHHCTQILHRTWDVPATCRASLSLYNTREEVDRLHAGLVLAQRTFRTS